MNGFTVETEQLADDTHIVSVAGELDMYTAPPFEEQLIAALDNGTDRLVVDLRPRASRP
jgi:anti-sigma B factor antagonist